MKIARFHDGEHIRLGLVEDAGLFPMDYRGDMLEFISSDLDFRHGDRVLSLDEVRYAPVIDNPSKIIAIGLNYMDHIRESKGEIPETPLVFAKFPNSLVGHNEPITWNPELTRKVDFEAEMAVIIGKRTCRCPEDRAMEAVFGYACSNDVSARDLQFGDGQWVRGKSLDTFCPIGPWIATPDEIPDPHALDIRSRLNGEIMQDSNTGMMIFRLPRLISFLSMNFTLVPGDIILTGTPHGVGAFRDPSVYMKDGDEIEVEIQGLGRLKNVCRTL